MTNFDECGPMNVKFIDRINSYFRRNMFSEFVSYWLSTVIITSFFQRKKAAFIEIAVRKLVRRTYGGIRLVSFKHHILNSFKEAVILVSQYS